MSGSLSVWESECLGVECLSVWESKCLSVWKSEYLNVWKFE